MAVIIVTGGAGFIGSNFIDLLLSKTSHTVICVDALTYAGNVNNLYGHWKDPRLEFVRHDISHPINLKDYGADFVVHFAAESHVDRSIDDTTPFLKSNIIGTYNMMKMSMEDGIKKFVHVSTDEVYGSLGLKDKPFTEYSPIAPNNPYSASKASSDMLVRSFFRTYGFPGIITRCSNNYGPFQFPEKLVPLVITRSFKNEKIPVYGEGKNIRDWIHVKDHCAGILMALENGTPGEVYNFGGNEEITNIDLVKTILYLTHNTQDLIEFVKDRPGHDIRYAMNHCKATKDLGWKPKINLTAGLIETIAWYTAHKDWIRSIDEKSYVKDNDHYGDYFA